MTGAGLVIIGAGHAGIRAALAARSVGFSGRVTIVADDGSKDPYERPPLSKWSVPDADESRLRRSIFPAEQVADAAIEWIGATVTELDCERRMIRLESGETLPYSRLLLATGARPRQLKVPGSDTVHVHYLRTHKDAEVLQQACGTARRALIIGGGFIGLELAASLRKRGIAVHVLEAEERLLARTISAPVAQVVQDLHVANGVEFSFGAQLLALKQEGSQITAHLDGGNSITADLVIAGIGSVPETSLAQAAGIRVDNGIVVDRNLQTNVPGIFAAGDCCRFPLYGADGVLTRLESWQAAGDQGALSGRNMVADGSAEHEAFLGTPLFWSEQYDHILQVAGLPNSDAQPAERSYEADHHISFGVDRDGSLASACGIAPGTAIAKDIRFSMKMIKAGSTLTISELSDNKVPLKSLLKR